MELFALVASPLVASCWLDKTHKTLVDRGLNDDADRMASKMREVERKSIADLRTYLTTITIPKEEIDTRVAAILDGDIETALGRFAGTFVVDHLAITKDVVETAKESPFLSMLRVSIVDHDGREVGSVGSVEDDMDGRVVFELHQRLKRDAPSLRHTIGEMWKRHTVDSARILQFLGTSSPFQVERHPLIGKGLDAYAAQEDYVALCVLLPEIEAGLRRLQNMLGGSVYKRARNGGVNLRNLDELLRDPVVVQALSERVSFYLRVLLTDARGWNLRNVICHGLTRAMDINRSLSDRVFHALVLLGCLRLSEAPAE